MVNEQVDKVKNMKRKQLLSTNKRTIQNLIPVLITYKRYLPNISNINGKKNAKIWNILQISPTLQNVFDKKPMIIYKRNKNHGELIGGHTLKDERRSKFKTFRCPVKLSSKQGKLHKGMHSQ